jgi:hypothetical protein
MSPHALASLLSRRRTRGPWVALLMAGCGGAVVTDTEPTSPPGEVSGSGGQGGVLAGQGGALAAGQDGVPAGQGGAPSAGTAGSTPASGQNSQGGTSPAGAAGTTSTGGTAGTDAGGAGSLEGGAGGEPEAGAAGEGAGPQAGTSPGGAAGKGAAGSPEAGAAGSGAGSSGQGGATGLAGSSGAAGFAGQGPPGDCPTGLPGPAMTRISVSAQQAYCMDRNEVTQGQYAAFLQAKGKDTSGQLDPVCAKYNGSYSIVYASDTGEGCPAGGFTPETTPDIPVSCVDWCDATAYCRWAGKRLCGRIGGGSVPVADGAASLQSQWYYACSQGGKTKYPYGDTYTKGLCNDRPPTNPNVPTAARPAKDSPCHAPSPPFDSLVDLSGDLEEWEDSCDEVHCRTRGGATSGSPDEVSCSADSLWGKLVSPGREVGFRCCAD